MFDLYLIEVVILFRGFVLIESYYEEVFVVLGIFELVSEGEW